MTVLSEYLLAHLPPGSSKAQLVAALDGRLDRTTVYRYLAGNHPRKPPEYVLAHFAEVLPTVTLVGLREAAGVPVGLNEPWIPPLEANRLNAAQRHALEEFIRATVNAEDSEAEQPPSDPELQTHVREYGAQLRAQGQDELADRLEASLIKSSADETVNRSSKV